MARREARDVPLAVVGPGAGCSPDELRAVGAALRAWLSARGDARRVYGLDDLEAGRMPVSPAAHVLPAAGRFPAERWPVALAVVVAGADPAAAAADLEAALGGVRDRLAVLMDPQTYDAFTR